MRAMPFGLSWDVQDRCRFSAAFDGMVALSVPGCDGCGSESASNASVLLPRAAVRREATLRSAGEGLWVAVMDSITAWFVAIAHLFYSTPGRACAAEAEKKEIFYVQGHCRGMLCALQEALYVDRTIDPIESPKFRDQH
jgi:hypothetical protein